MSPSDPSSFWLENVCFALPNLSPIPSVLSQTCLAYMLLTSPTDELEIFRYPGNARSKVWNILVFIN